jgi:hypothetical protein
VTDARWEDVNADVDNAVTHFRNALLLRAASAADAVDFERYRDDMAFMHAMQSAYNSAEAALLKVLSILDEEAPTGEHWHRDLIERLGRPAGGAHKRPAVLPTGAKADLHETRNFRHRATHSYGDFDIGKSGPSEEAARRLITSFPIAIAAFRQVVDPD